MATWAERERRGADRIRRIFDIPRPVQRAWFERAYEHGKLWGSWHEVVYETAEWEAWAAYFYALGWRPVTFGMKEPSERLVDGTHKARVKLWTAPCRWPSDLGF